MNKDQFAYLNENIVALEAERDTLKEQWRLCNIDQWNCEAERDKLKALLKECREFMADDGGDFWLPAYEAFRARLDEEIR